MKPFRILPLLGAALLAAACGDDPNDPGPDWPPQGALVSGDLQTDTVGDRLPQPIVVRVTDQDGDPVSGQTVTFAVTAGGGTVFAATAQTNAAGEASNQWTLGTVAGDTQRVEARMVDPESGQPVVLATFRAVGLPDAPAAITARPPTDRTGSAGQALADSLEAFVADQYGNPVPGATVAWLAVSGGGTVAPATTVTGANGIARASWTLGRQVGTQQEAEASLSPAVRARFTATAGVPVGATLVKVSGDLQSATVGSTLPQPLVVEVRTATGLPLQGVSVSFTPAPNAGTATPPAAVTGADGRAATSWTLGTAPGPRTLMASADGVGPVTFSATANPGAAASLTIAGGNGQTAPPNSPLPVPLGARVTDGFGNPLAGVTVTWTVASGGGAVVPVVSQTAANGVAQTQWALGPEVGTQTVTASAPGTSTVTFTATAQIGALDRIEVTPATVSFTAFGETRQLTARAVDAFGNTVPGVTIVWSSTNPGVATVSGTGLVTAVGNGLTQVRASGGGKVGIAGVSVQQAAASVSVTSPRASLIEYDTVRLAAVVRDARNNVIPGAQVTWTSSAPAIAPITPDGLVTARGGGTPTFTATAANGASGSRGLTLEAAFKPDTLATGAFHSCGIRGGTAYCWGANQSRQLGFASPNQSGTPRAVAGHTFASITTGDSRTGGEYNQSHTCAVEPDGDAYCWGNNESGQLGYDDGRAVIPGDSDNTDDPDCGIAEYGFICEETPTMVAGGGWMQLDAGSNHTCGITTSGVAYCWGKATTGALGTTQPVETCFFYQAGPTGYTFGCALTPKPVAGGHTFKQVSAGEDFTCALTTAGQAWCWGRNGSGQLGDGTTTTRTTPVQVQGGLTFARISAGRAHACGVTTGGAVYCWGSNGSGRLGIGSIDASPHPAPLAVAGTYQVVSAGNEHTCAITSAGRIACWGDNARSQIGDGTTTDRPSPTLNPSTRVFRDVGAGYGTSCAQLAADGAVFCWGRGTPANELGGSTGPSRGAVRAPS